MELEHLPVVMMGLFLLVVAGRVAFQVYLVGNSGIRSGTRLKTKKEFLISFMMFGVLGIQTILTWLYSESYISAQIEFGTIGKLLGLTLCIGGLAFASYSQLAMGEDWRIGVDPDEETKLVTTGIYDKIRNPIYTGCIVHGAGVVALAPHLLIFITGLVGYFAIRAYVKDIEEPYLINLHGDEYRQYMTRTGSFLPRF